MIIYKLLTKMDFDSLILIKVPRVQFLSQDHFSKLVKYILSVCAIYFLFASSNTLHASLPYFVLRETDFRKCIKKMQNSVLLTSDTSNKRNKQEVSKESGVILGIFPLNPSSLQICCRVAVLSFCCCCFNKSYN